MGSTTREHNKENKTEEPEPCLVQSLCILKKSVHDWHHLTNIENKTPEAQNKKHNNGSKENQPKQKNQRKKEKKDQSRAWCSAFSSW